MSIKMLSREDLAAKIAKPVVKFTASRLRGLSQKTLLVSLLSYSSLWPCKNLKCQRPGIWEADICPLSG